MAWSFSLGIGEQGRAAVLEEARSAITSLVTFTVIARPESGTLLRIPEMDKITQVRLDGAGWKVSVTPDDDLDQKVHDILPSEFSGISLRVEALEPAKGKGDKGDKGDKGTRKGKGKGKKGKGKGK